MEVVGHMANLIQNEDVFAMMESLEWITDPLFPERQEAFLGMDIGALEGHLDDSGRNWLNGCLKRVKQYGNTDYEESELFRKCKLRVEIISHAVFSIRNEWKGKGRASNLGEAQQDRNNKISKVSSEVSRLRKVLIDAAVIYELEGRGPNEVEIENGPLDEFAPEIWEMSDADTFIDFPAEGELQLLNKPDMIPDHDTTSDLTTMEWETFVALNPLAQQHLQSCTTFYHPGDA